MIFIQVQKTPTRCGPINAGATIINTGNVPVYLANDPVTVSNAPNAGDVVYPGGQLVWERAANPLWAIDLTGYLPTIEIIDRSSQQNSGTTVALIDQPKLLTGGNVTAAATPGQTKIGPFLTAAFVSWVIQIQFSTPIPATNYMAVNFLWSADPAGLIVLHSMDYVLDSSVNNQAFYWGHGPMWGPYLTIVFENYNNATTTFQFNLYGSNRPFTETQIRSAGQNVSPSNADDDVLASQDGSLATNTSSATFQCSFYDGPVVIRLGAYGNAAVNTLQCFFKFEPAAVDFATNTSLVIAGPPSITGKPNDVPVFFYFPKRPVSFSLTNFDTATVSYRVRVIAKGPAV